MYINILLDTLLASPVIAKRCSHRLVKKATNIYGEQDLFLAIAAKDCGMPWTTKHNKAAVRGWLVSQLIIASLSMPVIHRYLVCLICQPYLLGAVGGKQHCGSTADPVAVRHIMCVVYLAVVL